MLLVDRGEDCTISKAAFYCVHGIQTLVPFSVLLSVLILFSVKIFFPSPPLSLNALVVKFN